MARPSARVLLSACVLVAGASAARAGFDEHLAVVSTDYTSPGSLSTMQLTSPFTTDIDIETVGTDPVIRYWHDRIYVVNRFGNDAVQVIDPATHDTVLEFSVGALSNPQDIAVVDGTTAFVSRFGSRWLYVVNPTTGAVVDSVDLGGFADADGRPEMSYMALAGDRLFVQLQRLDTDGFYDPVPPSYMAVIDVPSRTLVDVNPVAPGTQAITLTGTNPQQKMHLDEAGRRLYVAEIGAFVALDGGVEAIDIDTYAPLGYVLSEATLGGDVSTPVIVSATRGYVLTSTDAFFTTRVTAFDPTTGSVTGTLHTTPAFTSGLLVDATTGRLYLADRRTTQPGIRIFDTATNMQITSSPISVGLPPVDLAVVRAPVVDVAGGGAPVAPVARAVPNPFTRSTTFAFAAGEVPAGVETVEVFAPGGRRVRTLGLDAAAGSTDITWDGTDARGRPVAAGVYVFRLGDTRRGGRVVLVR